MAKKKTRAPTTSTGSTCGWATRTSSAGAAHGDLAEFYADLRGPDWEREVRAVELDRGLHFAPPLFTREGWAARMDPRSRRPAPLAELWGLWHDIRAQLG